MKCTAQIEFPCWTEINMQHKPLSAWISSSSESQEPAPLWQINPECGESTSSSYYQNSASFAASVEQCMQIAFLNAKGLHKGGKDKA